MLSCVGMILGGVLFVLLGLTGLIDKTLNLRTAIATGRTAEILGGVFLLFGLFLIAYQIRFLKNMLRKQK